MSWRPTVSGDLSGHDARLDPYRERAAILSHQGEATATLFVRIETWWTQAEGHLWWRRWSPPFEVPHGYMAFVGGEFDEWIVGSVELDQDLEDWSRNKLRYVGQQLGVDWLDDATSEHVRESVLGLDPPVA